MSHIIQTVDLSFNYNKTSEVILNNISLNIPKGSIYGFLGPNGAGKSTTMRLLVGSLSSRNGQISIFNKPLKEQLPGIFKNIGCLIDSPTLYSHLSGFDNLSYIAEMKSIAKSEISEIFNLVGLTNAKKKKVKDYSLGMKQRLAIGVALLGNPELLLLDEPINGLDPQGIIDIRKLLVKLNKEQGITIFVSSHLLDEIERICTHIGVLNNGNLVFEGTIDALKKKLSTVQKMYLKIIDYENWYNRLKESNYNVKLSEDIICIETKNRGIMANVLIKLLKDGAVITEMKTSEGLENLFLQLTK